MKALILLPFLFVLGGCASGHVNTKLNFAHNTLALPLAIPPACDPDEPEPTKVPDGAGFPAAETPEASAAEQLYLTWLHSLSAWGKEGWRRYDAQCHR